MVTDVHAVKLKGGHLFCNLCLDSMRESLWKTHVKSASHIDRVQMAQHKHEEARARMEIESVQSRDSSSPENDVPKPESDNEFKREKVSEFQMPQLVPITGSDERIGVSDMTALDFETDANPVGDSFTPPLESSDFGLIDIEGRNDEDAMSYRREMLVSTIREGLERRSKKPKVLQTDSDDEEDDWRSKSV